MSPRGKSKTVGGYGYSVTLFERSPGGMLYLEWHEGEDTPRRSLGHRDWKRGEAEARQVAADLLSAGEHRPGASLTIHELLAVYDREHGRFQSRPAEYERRSDIWRAFLGAGTRMEEVTPAQLRRFARDRAAGRIRARGRNLQKVRARSIEADIRFLKAAFRWAVLEGLAKFSPIAEFEVPTEPNPHRPRVTHDEFEATVAQADAVNPMLRPLLMLVEAVGWRISALCALRPVDVDLHASEAAPFGRIHKRAATDKEKRDRWVPLSADGRAAVLLALQRSSAAGEAPLFRRSRTGKPWTRFYAQKLHRKAQLAAARAQAELEGVPFDPQAVVYFGFHAYRRKWATERKHLPRADVAAAGDWHPRTLEIYEQPDDETLLVVVTEPRKLRRTGHP